MTPAEIAIILQLAKLASIAALAGYEAMQGLFDFNSVSAQQKALESLRAIDAGLTPITDGFTNEDLNKVHGLVRVAIQFIEDNPENITEGIQLAKAAIGSFNDFVQGVEKQKFVERNQKAIDRFKARLGLATALLIAVLLVGGCAHRYSREYVDERSDDVWASVEMPLGVTVITDFDSVTSETLTRNPGYLEVSDDGFVRFVYKVPPTAKKDRFIHWPE